MAHPPKVPKLCDDLKCYIDMHCRPGGRLPAERTLAKIMGVSTRTLGTALRKLVEENRVVRNPKGTFVCDAEISARTDEVLTLLLPCSDFSFSGEPVSRLANQQMISGALAAARKFHRRVITIPVTDSNDPDDINPIQLSHLGPGSMVMFQSDWYERLFPLFQERKCRLAFLNCGSYRPEMLPPGLDCYLVNFGGYQLNLFLKSLEWFTAAGAKKILFAGDSRTRVLSPVKTHLADFLRRNPDRAEIRRWDAGLNYLQWAEWLKKTVAQGGFDGLMLYPDPFQYYDPELDFYELTGIPDTLPLLITDSSLLEQPRLAAHAGLIRIPRERYSRDAAEFLLSGRHGVEFVTAEYTIQPASQFPSAGFA